MSNTPFPTPLPPSASVDDESKPSSEPESNTGTSGNGWFSSGVSRLSLLSSSLQTISAEMKEAVDARLPAAQSQISALQSTLNAHLSSSPQPPFIDAPSLTALKTVYLTPQLIICSHPHGSSPYPTAKAFSDLLSLRHPLAAIYNMSEQVCERACIKIVYERVCNSVTLTPIPKPLRLRLAQTPAVSPQQPSYAPRRYVQGPALPPPGQSHAAPYPVELPSIQVRRHRPPLPHRLRPHPLHRRRPPLLRRPVQHPRRGPVLCLQGEKTTRARHKHTNAEHANISTP